MPSLVGTVMTCIPQPRVDLRERRYRITMLTESGPVTTLTEASTPFRFLVNLEHRTCRFILNQQGEVTAYSEIQVFDLTISSFATDRDRRAVRLHQLGPTGMGVVEYTDDVGTLYYPAIAGRTKETLALPQDLCGDGFTSLTEALDAACRQSFWESTTAVIWRGLPQEVKR